MTKHSNAIVLTMFGLLLTATTVRAKEEQKYPEELISCWDMTGVTVDGETQRGRKDASWTLNADGTILIRSRKAGVWYVDASGALVLDLKKEDKLSLKWSIEDDRLRLSHKEGDKERVMSFNRDNRELSDEEKAAEEAVRQFLKHLEAGDADKAFALVAISDKMPKEYVEHRKKMINKFAELMKNKSWHVSFVEIHSEGHGAIAITNEDKKNGEDSFDLDPMYLVELEGKWLVLPSITSHRDASLLVSEEECKIFKSLEKLFDERKDKLR